MKMTVSHEWLCSLVKDLNKKNPHEIAEAFTAIGAETEDVSTLTWGASCQLAQVKELRTLQGKNKEVLLECEGKTVQTVSNSAVLKKDDWVLFVPAGRELFGGRKVEARSIEGVTTQGLIAALEHLGIEEKSSDIFIFPHASSVQEDFTALCQDDAVYVLDVSGNRPDWLSVMGLAKALALFFDLEYTPSQISFTEGSMHTLPVRIESERCYRFSARLITDIGVHASPVRMQKRLHLLGMRPINNLVDLSNHIMLETGQPTHAYDASVISKGFVIRQAKEGERLMLLGGDQEIILTKDDLLICDEEKILGLAGIMGGAHSKVNPQTTAIILESAAFHGVHIRRSAKRLGLKTESSSRYEKNISPQLTSLADGLFASYFNTAVIAQKSEDLRHQYQRVQISIDPNTIRQQLGCTDISDAFMKKVFLGLGCTLEENEQWTITTPEERFDLTISADLAEEVARFYGYNNIPARSYRPAVTQFNPEMPFFDRIRPLLRGMGLHEAVNVSFRSPLDFQLFKIQDQPVRIENPLTEDFSLLRTHVFDGLVRTLAGNKKKAFYPSLAFSEIGHVFCKEGNDFCEEEHLSFALSEEQGAYAKALNILNVLMVYAKCSWTAKPQTQPFLHPKNSFTIMVGDQEIGFFGALHPEIESEMDLEQVVLCELDFTILKEQATVTAFVEAPSPLPPLLRDLTLTVPQSALAQNIAWELKAGYPYLKEVEFLNVYQNDKLQAEGMKNLSFRLRFEHYEILSAEEIDKYITSLLTKTY